MFLYSIKTLLLYGGGSFLLYLATIQFITPSKEEEIRKLYQIPKAQETKTKKELVMLQMKHVAGLDKETTPSSDKKS